MKDKTTGGELRPESGIEPATEARIVALVLGEASDFEEVELNRLVAKWPEMRVLQNRLEAVDTLLWEAIAPQSASEWKLSAHLRDKLVGAMDSVSGWGLRRREADRAEAEAAEKITPFVPVTGGEEVAGRSARRLRIPWWRAGAACVAILLMLVAVYGPTIFEEERMVAAELPAPASGAIRSAWNGEPATVDGDRKMFEGNDRLLALNDAIGPDGETGGGGASREYDRARVSLGVTSTFSEEHYADPIKVADNPGALLLKPGDVIDVPAKNWFGGEPPAEVNDAKAPRRVLRGVTTVESADLGWPDMDQDGAQGGGGAEVQTVSRSQDSGSRSWEQGQYSGYTAGIDLPENKAEEDLERVQAGRRALSVLRESGLGAAHPRVVEQQAVIEEGERDLTARVADLQEVLQTQLALVDGQLEEMKQVGDERRFSAVDKALQSQDYVEARRDYENAKETLRTMKLNGALNWTAGSKLDDGLRRQEKLVEEKRKLFHTTVKSVGIPYIEGGRGSGQMGRSEEEILRTAQKHEYEKKVQKQKLELQLKTLMRLRGEELMHYAAGLQVEGSEALVRKSLTRGKTVRFVTKGEVRALAEPHSTFSLHVSDVSFKLAKAALARGEWPEAEKIRVEEFVNAFDYGGNPPSMAERVGGSVEQAAHPTMQQRNLVRISVRTAAQGRSTGTPLRLTVLLDNSGSMQRYDRAESVQRAFEMLATQMTEADQVTLISFARQPRLLADRMPGNKAGELRELIGAMQAEGGTNLEAALRLGLEKAAADRMEGGQSRVILLTDGAANLGNADPGDLARVVDAMRGKGIAFDACGVGAAGLNDRILESLTRRGNGRYYLLDEPGDADEGFARQIAGALRPAAENVKVQVHFNPQRVGRYKLHGYDKHRLATDDFRDDRVDAAEMAAEESGTALYRVEVLPEGLGEIGTVSVRFRDTASGHMVEKRWTIPYEPTVQPLAQASPAIQLAAGAMLTAEKLRGSADGEAMTTQNLARLVSGLPGQFPGSDRVRELVEMVRGM